MARKRHGTSVRRGPLRLRLRVRWRVKSRFRCMHQHTVRRLPVIRLHRRCLRGLREWAIFLRRRRVVGCLGGIAKLPFVPLPNKTHQHHASLNDPRNTHYICIDISLRTRTHGFLHPRRWLRQMRTAVHIIPRRVPETALPLHIRVHQHLLLRGSGARIRLVLRDAHVVALLLLTSLVLVWEALLVFALLLMSVLECELLELGLRELDSLPLPAVLAYAVRGLWLKLSVICILTSSGVMNAVWLYLHLGPGRCLLTK